MLEGGVGSARGRGACGQAQPARGQHVPQLQQPQCLLAWEREQLGTREGESRVGLVFFSSLYFFNALLQVGETLLLCCGTRTLL